VDGLETEPPLQVTAEQLLFTVNDPDCPHIAVAPPEYPATHAKVSIEPYAWDTLADAVPPTTEEFTLEGTGTEIPLHVTAVQLSGETNRPACVQVYASAPVYPGPQP
jgi:hypothetical protein